MKVLPANHRLFRVPHEVIIMQNVRVFPAVINQFFTQLFYYINARLFNYLLKRRDLCTCGMGFHLKVQPKHRMRRIGFFFFCIFILLAVRDIVAGGLGA
jgi:hypothetical protein